jgi:hypothetical protein
MKIMQVNPRKFSLCLSAGAALSICMSCMHQQTAQTAQTADGDRHVASLEVAPALELGEQWSAKNQTQVEQIIAINKQMLLARTAKSGYITRDAHPKTHGCVKARIEVNGKNLAPELQVGVFAPTARRNNEAWIRYSNGNPDGENTPDSTKDIRGMAIKIMNVDGSSSGSQDFVMLTSKEFFSRDGDDYIALHNALASHSNLKLAGYFATHLREFFILNGGQIAAANPLQIEYFSSVPYKLGPRTMKFKARPCDNSQLHDTVPDGMPAANYLRERLVSSLKNQGACYELWVQPNMDMEMQSVENPMISWNEFSSPYIKVARITIPQQDEIDSSEHLNFCENLSFNPWHTLPETRPMGQINRMRAQIYPAISEFRHQRNHIPLLEPRTLDICKGETATLCQAPQR